ncbi:MAG: TRAP transporter small permease [Desulfatiglandaceae bacterium]
MLSSFYHKLTKINSLVAAISCIILLFVTFSIFVDVILRYFFGSPSTWITEVSTYLFLYIIFFGTPYALQQGLHVKVTFLLDRFSTRKIRVLNLVTSILATIFAMVLLWQTSIMTWTAFKEKWTSPTMLSVPYSWIYVAMVIGSFLLLLTFLCEAILSFKGKS